MTDPDVLIGFVAKRGDARPFDEMSNRTIEQRFLLRPNAELRRRILGIIGLALTMYDVQLYDFVFMSNHFHLFASSADPAQLSKFMGFVTGNIAVEINKRLCRSGPVWARPFSATPLSGEEDVERRRVAYVLSHGAKEGLVSSPRLWPGASSLPARLDGATLRGAWLNRTAMYLDSRLKLGCKRETEYEIEYDVVLTPWPHMAGKCERERRRDVADMIANIESDAAERAMRTGRKALGVARILRQRPTDRPRGVVRKGKPRFHVAGRELAEAMERSRAAFVAAYRAASAAFRAGDLNVAFPPYSFRPSSPMTAGLPLALPP